MRVGNVDEPLIHGGKVDTDVVQHEPHFAAVDEPHKVQALAVYVVDAVQKACDDDLASGVLVMREDLVDEDRGVRGFQHRDGRDHLLQSARPAQDLRLPQRGELQQIRYLTLTLCLLFLSADLKKSSGELRK